MIQLFVASFLVLVAGCLLWLPARPGPRALLLGGSVVAVSLLTCMLIVAGLAGKLNRPFVLALLAAVVVVAALTSYKRIPSAVARVRQARTALRIPRPSLLPALVLVALIASMLLVFFLGTVLPPTDWDGLAQNLPMAAFHLQTESIKPVDTPYRGIRAYPQGGALLLAFDMLAEQGDVAADLVQFPFWLLGTLAVYSIARELGAERGYALAGATIFAAAPVVVLQARSAYFDLEIAALALAGLALSLDRRIRFTHRSLVVGCAAGLLAGLKYAGLIYLALLGIILVGAGLSEQRMRREMLGGIVAFGLAAVALGGIWYFFNWRSFGNPFWPMELRLGPLTLFPGVWTTQSFYVEAKPAQIASLPNYQALLTVWREPIAAYAADMRLGGLGPLWYVFGPISVVAFSVITVRRPSYPRIALLGFILAAFVLTPANWHTRYVLGSVGAAGACLAVVLQQLSLVPRRAVQATVTLLACLTLLVVPALGNASTDEVARNLQLPLRDRAAALMTGVAAVDPAHGWLYKHVRPGSSIAYGWGGVVLYPLFGPRLANELIYVAPGSDYGLALARAGASYLVVRLESDEAKAALDDPSLHEAFRSSAYAVFEVASHG